MDKIKAENRNPKIKAKQLRQAGIIPGVLSGAALKESLLIQMEQSAVSQLKRTKRTGSKLEVELEGTLYPVLIKEIEYNTLKHTVAHISFQLLDADKKVNSVADIVLLNRNKVPGVLEQMLTKVPHAAVPKYLLDTVAVDLTSIPVGTTLTVGDIPAFNDENIELQVDPGSAVLRIRDRKRPGAGAPPTGA